MTPRRRPPTLRGRVSALALVVLACWVALVGGAFALIVSARTDAQLDGALRVRAQAASATIMVRGGRITGVRDSATDSELDGTIWVYSGGSAVVRPRAPADEQRGADRAARTPGTVTRSEQRRFYAVPVVAGGRRIGAVVASLDVRPFDGTHSTVVVGVLVTAVFLLAGAYPVLRLATGRALRPVGTMTRRAADWSLSAPLQRFGPDQRYAELSSLAGTLDQLLDRLAAVLRHERQLSAELSHELRTPLARTIAEIDVVLAGAPTEAGSGPVRDQHTTRYRAALAAVRANCVAMDGIIDTLLAAARQELRAVGHSPLQPVLAGFAVSDGVPTVRAQANHLSAGVESDVITRMLSPIVDNARRHAASEVQLSARRLGGSVAVEISNDGPSIDPHLLERIFEPGFTDGAGDQAQGHGGAGLGLALARRLAQAADGDVTVDPAATRTTFVVTLPAG